MENGISIMEDIIRSYPKLAERVRDRILAGKISAYETVRRGHGGRSDPTAAAALAELPPEEQRCYEAIQWAIRHTQGKYQNGAERLFVIRLLYWSDAAHRKILSQYSASAVREYQRDFIQAVAQKLGLCDCEGCSHWRDLLGHDSKACHYCYDTGKPRSHDGIRCYSKSLDPNLPRSSFYSVSICNYSISQRGCQSGSGL